MDTLDTKRQEMFIRVREFGVQYAATFPAGSYGAGLFEQLGEVVENLRAHSLEQSKGRSSVRESSASKSAARDELLRRMESVSRTARVLAYNTPGLEDKFRMPRGVGDQALLTLARTFASDARPLKAEFTKRGLGADFIQELDETAGAFDSAINQKVQHRGKQVAATAAIDGLIERGLRIARELDALVRNTRPDDPPALAAWESASHVEKPTRRGRHKSSGSPEAAPAQT
ncbi:MAG: hypothetical protein LC795_07375 [Acidobacteria bacterium]|nr:hypothetical protein [Acidobacteriota bacterium]